MCKMFNRFLAFVQYGMDREESNGIGVFHSMDRSRSTMHYASDVGDPTKLPGPFRGGPIANRSPMYPSYAVPS